MFTNVEDRQQEELVRELELRKTQKILGFVDVYGGGPNRG